MAVTVRDGREGKVCSRCRKWKPLTQFSPDATKPESQRFRDSRCKECYAQAREEKRKRAQAAASVIAGLS